ncbi:MAG: helix-turn-helix domain-containing protein [Planctomycetes bacterium]|nr:helix-turn-helix domain-containing protein [Planctomycetota bacterium]
MNTVTKNKPETPCLSMRRREAAAAIGISVGELDTWTKKGIIPCVRVGRIVLYPVSTIWDWLNKQAQQGVTAGDNFTEK